MEIMFFYLISLLLSVFFAGILIPKILLIAFRKKLFDIPDERKIHTSAVPRLGGVAFMPVILFTIFFILGIDALFSNVICVTDAVKMYFALCSVLILYIVGIADDLIGVKFKAKFVVQIIAGILLVSSGLYMRNLGNVFNIETLSSLIVYPLTIFVLVFIINAINLIDGIDGLASGLSAVSFIFYSIIFIKYEYYLNAIISLSTLGVIIPFFYYNVFGNPDRGRKIFMGDTGSLTLGFIIAFQSLTISNMVEINFSSEYDSNIIAFAPLMIPCFDVVRVVIVRLRNGKHPFKPDKNHIHHLFLQMGFSHKKVMMFILIVSFICTILNIYISKYISVLTILLIDILLFVLLTYIIGKKNLNRN